MQHDESQDCLAGKCNKLHEVIWEIELLIVYAREDRDSVHNSSGGMLEDYKHKPEKVYKYDDRDRFSDSDDSQESSPHPAGFTDVTPPPGALDICTLILPRMCILGCFKEDNKSKCREQGKRRPPNSLECHWFDWRI